MKRSYHFIANQDANKMPDNNITLPESYGELLSLYSSYQCPLWTKLAQWAFTSRIREEIRLRHNHMYFWDTISFDI